MGKTIRKFKGEEIRDKSKKKKSPKKKFVWSDENWPAMAFDEKWSFGSGNQSGGVLCQN